MNRLSHGEPSFSEASKAMIDRVGQHIGNYRLLRLLGQGGFAQVYLGEHRYLKSAAALKVLQRSLSEQEAQRFLEEAQTLVHLRHAHIIRVLDFAVERGTPVLVMDYVPGGTLRQRHPRGTCLSLEMTVEYVKQVAAALQYAHNHHIIHRDVKPDNLLLDSDERLVLSDFGLALFAPSPDLLSTQALVGTLPYVAPEQVQGKPCFASDQYALGVLTYEWLTGVRPFEGNAWELIQQHLTVDPSPLRERCPDLPVTVERVVLRALAKNPQDRYVSVSAFAQALERACGASSNDDSQITAALLSASDSSTPVLARSSRHTARTIFLSAAPGDESVAARLAADLKRRGLLLSNDLSGRLPGADREETVWQAMRAADCVVVVVTPQTRSSRVVREHLGLAQMYQRRLVLVWVQGEEMATMLLDHTWEQLLPVDVLDARGSRYQTALDELLLCLRGDTRVFPDEEATLSTTPGEHRDPRNPYKGLRAFREADALDFFGRDGLLEEMVQQLEGMLAPELQAGAGPRLLTIVGPSGSGKSSVVLAGLLPRLRAGALAGSQAWVYLDPIMPGPRPLEALALTLASHFPDRSLKTMYQDLRDDSARGLHWLSMQLVKEAGSRVVLVIDQFEEVFTQTISEEERRCFVDLLVTAVTEVRGSVLVLLTLRADFSDRPMRYPALARVIEAHRQPVLPMELHELREVIEGPAALPDAHLTFEGNLVGDLLFETQGQVGALPLLEFTLDQLFQHREGQTLTMTSYQQIGRVKGALAKHAEATYAALPSEEHQHLARALFLRLIDPGLSEQDTTRRRASLAELSLPNAKQTVILQEVADAFIAARLLTTNEIAGTTTIEVSHEALIREWPRLSDWLREGREDIRLQQAVSQDVVEWERRGRPKDRLYRGYQLKEAKVWARRSVPSEQEMAFLRTSAVQQTRSRTSLAALVLLLVLALGSVVQLVQSQQASNSTIVTNLNDAGPGSLRQIIYRAPDRATITFDKNLRGTILLTNGNLSINKNLTIQGPDADNLTVSSGAGGYAIEVNSGVTVSLIHLAFKNSTVKSLIGNVPESFITNNGTLTLINSRVSDNTAIGAYGNGGNGGGITNNGTLTLINSRVSDNTAAGSSGPSGSCGRGGGIYNTGTLTLTNSTVSGNTAAGIMSVTVGSKNTYDTYGQGGKGGGIYNNGTLMFTNSTVSDNRALSGVGGSQANGNGGGRGGGIYNYVSGSIVSTVTIIKSIIARNIASGGISSSPKADSGNGGAGGGIFFQTTSSARSKLTLTDSIVADNTAAEAQRTNSDFTSSNGGSGGGIYAITTYSPVSTEGGLTLTLTNSTISNNTAAGSGSHDGGSGGGIFNDMSTLILASSTISSNRATGDSTGDSLSKDGKYSSGGGGIYNGGGDFDSSQSNNYSQGNNYVYGRLTLTNSTISDNTTGSSGGGISNWGGQMEMTFCTLYGNTAANGGGVAIEDGYHNPNLSAPHPTYQPVPSRVQMRNSIVANDHAQTGPDIAGALTSGGYNLIQNVSGATFGPSKRSPTDVSVDPSTNLEIDSQLSGPKPQTLALLLGSPAIDRIPADACHPTIDGITITTDQRGVKRPQGTKCDIGAYEYVAAR